MSNAVQDDLRARALEWLREDPDEATRAELQQLIDKNDRAQLEDRFLAKLEFGTAGLRGVLGAGPNRMNRSVVLRTTAGLCAYLRKQAPDAATRGVVIGYDGRRMSRRFAEDVAEVCAGAGVRAFLFADMVPTPVVAFAVNELGAAAGVMVTASHNPPEYNGYKVYWGNGAQIVPPHDAGIAAAIDAVGSLLTVPRPILKESRAKGLVFDPPADIEERYLAAVRALCVHPESASAAALALVYTPLHGVGERFAQQALARAGFGRVYSVPEQAKPDGSFPTVAFPNPEEKGALDLAFALAKEKNADLILANDPDADRLAVAVPDGAGGWVQLTGNEVGVLLGYYALTEDPKQTADRLVVTTIVSSPMLGVMARELGVRYEETLTGFKWIANRALELEKSEGLRFVFGYEEALGYTVGTVARDKDGVGAAAVFAELAAFYRAKHGRSVLEQLDEVYRRFGVFVSGQHNVTIKGLEGAAAIQKIMAGFRAAPPERVGGVEVERVTDVQKGERFAPGAGAEKSGASVEKLALPSSNVIAYALADGSRVTLRPSGTEPKIKYYFDVREPVAAGESVADARARAKDRLAVLTAAFVAMAAERQKG